VEKKLLVSQCLAEFSLYSISGLKYRFRPLILGTGHQVKMEKRGFEEQFLYFVEISL